MPVVSARVESGLRGIFGDRVRTDRIERKIYSSDIGAMPKLVKPFVPAGIAGAVVRPKSAEELGALLALAAREGVSVVPRGFSTSGYGGALPAEGAIVADMSAMSTIVAVDKTARTARVQAGVIWEVLEKRLHKDGLDLRLYPSSSPSSTVGGWLAQGGAGFGSWEYGVFADNVLSARVVLPSGEIRDFVGEELRRHISDAEGTTGIITEVELALRDLEPDVHRAMAFEDARALGAALSAISARKLPIWSLTYLNPESMRLKKRLPHRHGHPYEIAHAEHHVEPVLPVAYILVVAYPESRRPVIDGSLTEIVTAAGGSELSAEAAEHEWDLRFAPMRLKRIGPSIVPTEVVVPLSEMANVLVEIDEKIHQPFVLECMLVKGDDVVMLGFIPHDERSFAFNLAFALSLSVIRIAKQHGGRAYSTGLYFRGEAESVLGSERVRDLAAFKAKVDPKNVMNPGKVMGGGFIGLLMGGAQALEPMIRPFANAATVKTGDLENLTRDRNGVPGAVAFMAYSCARCGYCVPTCEQYSGRGWESQSPRGRYTILREVAEGREKFNRKMIDSFLNCTTCEVCNGRCQLGLPIEHNWMTMRGELVNEQKLGTHPGFEMMSASLDGELDIWAFKREHRADWVPEDMKPKLADERGGWEKPAEILYFAGCTASLVEKDIAEASVRLLTDAGYDIGYMGTDEACCGIPMKVAGKWDQFEEIYRHNTAEARRRGAKTIVTSCPACSLVWKEIYAGVAAERGEPYEFAVKHYSELVADAFTEGRLDLKEIDPSYGKLTFHDSCHAGRAQGIYEPPREMLRAIPGADLVEMEHHHEDSMCCGSVATLVGEIEVGPVLGKVRLQEAVDAGASTVVALCPCCQVQLRDSVVKNDFDLQVTDLSRLVAESMGYDIPDSTEEANYAWSFFEKFIILMEPKNMAALMERIFPQMMDAMPLGMKPMMKSMKYVPGGLSLMEKVMPLMFPMLIDGIMAKVMPDMVKAVQDYIGPMPDDMEALIPGLLPKTVGSLMPTYLPQLIPHVTPRMIEYIRTSM